MITNKQRELSHALTSEFTIECATCGARVRHLSTSAVAAALYFDERGWRPYHKDEDPIEDSWICAAKCPECAGEKP